MNERVVASLPLMTSQFWVISIFQNTLTPSFSPPAVGSLSNAKTLEVQYPLWFAATHVLLSAGPISSPGGDRNQIRRWRHLLLLILRINSDKTSAPN